MKKQGAHFWPLCGLIETVGISFLHVSLPLLARRSTADDGDKLILLQMQTLSWLILLSTKPNVDKSTMKVVALSINTIDTDKMDWIWKRKSRPWDGTIVLPIPSLVCASLMHLIWPLVVKEEGTTMVVFGSSLKT
jgi:hypothetical protein